MPPGEPVARADLAVPGPRQLGVLTGSGTVTVTVPDGDMPQPGQLGRVPEQSSVSDARRVAGAQWG